ncbi:MAG: H-type small acid-soluble spore protein [Lachnospiraceae bacterium]|jgi:H-type small acid-soluble spore protein|nr:H-type small acid-soluble spore protein [Lachnospiraceae bacterium]
MNEQRLTEVLRNRHLHEVYYNDRPVWIQEVKGNVATIGFVDGSGEKNVFIEDLYEDDLYPDD